MAGYRKKNYMKSDREILIHKTRFLLDNHWKVDEIAAELHIPISQVRSLITVAKPEKIFDLE